VVGPDDTVDVRTVRTDARVGSLWIVAEGLKLGDRVVVEGADRLRSGQKVQLEASAASPAAASR
jgi:multidrug efflux pump subunit AcrA (membrane-fusion protein)